MLGLYQFATRLITPFAGFFLQARVKRGKEDPNRLNERLGKVSLPRPKGDVLWIHAASVGELNSAQPLVNALLKREAGWTILLTSGTVTAARRAAAWSNPRVIHQFIPLDTPKFVARFLDHWQPALGLFIESEIWPNLILSAKDHEIPLALLNARISKKSSRRWAGIGRNAARHLFGAFDLITCQDEETVGFMRRFSSKRVEYFGNLKLSIQPLENDATLSEILSQFAAGASLFLGASTHPEDEPILLDAFRLVREQEPETKLVIAPRHPDRAPAVSEQARSMGFTVARLASASGLTGDVLILDRIGVLGACYRQAKACFLGGGFGTRGGHTPVEGILLGCRIHYGPDRKNFLSVAPVVEEFGAAKIVNTAHALAEEALVDLRRSGEGHGAEIERIARIGADCLEKTLDALAPLVPNPGGEGE